MREVNGEEVIALIRQTRAVPGRDIGNKVWERGFPKQAVEDDCRVRKANRLQPICSHYNRM